MRMRRRRRRRRRWWRERYRAEGVGGGVDVIGVRLTIRRGLGIRLPRKHVNDVMSRKRQREGVRERPTDARVYEEETKVAEEEEMVNKKKDYNVNHKYKMKRKKKRWNRRVRRRKRRT